MAVEKYPFVFGEVETIKKIKKGFSIGRLGDGELKCMDGFGYVREEPNPDMAEELQELCANPHEKCLVGIPTLDPNGSHYAFFKKHEARFCKYLVDGVKYYSALISRPDCGDWMDNREYATLVQSMWLGRGRVTLVAEPEQERKFLKVIEKTNRVQHVKCLFRGAYSQIDQLEQQILDTNPDVVIISAGPTATCLAHRLSKNVQAIDLGSIGGFLYKHFIENKTTFEG